MMIGILGAGFTGLAAGLRLAQKGHQVSIFEKEDTLGGLAGGFKKPNWEWTAEKSYHHFFTNDYFALELAQELNQPLIIKRPQTNVFLKGKILPLDSPLSLLSFPYLSLPDRFRMGFITSYLKLSNNYQRFEKEKALEWLRKKMGKRSVNLIWEPLFQGKFGQYKEDISLTWFWARIKKRTPNLAYPKGGFLDFAKKIGQEIEKSGGKINLNSEVSQIRLTNKGQISLVVKDQVWLFDKIISTLPSPIFAKITSGLPSSYINQINSINHLFAQNLILILKKPFLKETYWLNISQKDFPFVVLAEHTNFMEPKYYHHEHILYIGNYLPPDHSYLKMSARELLKIFTPYLKKINPTFPSSLLTSHLFTSPFAQPIVTTNYLNQIPQMKTPLKNVYLANLDMVYPWDRGTNYAIELGEKAARLILNETF